MHPSPLNTILEFVSHALKRHPELGAKVEQLAAELQGKGWGTGTVTHEAKLATALAGTLPKTVIDVGGNIGEWTNEIKRLSPNCHVSIFEPSSTNVEKLKDRFRFDTNIRIVPKALGRINAEGQLWSDAPGSGLASLTKRKLGHFGISFDTCERVTVMRFDDYWNKEMKRSPIDIAKLDVEGHELDVLKGFGDALKITRVIQFEFGGCNIDTRTFFQDYFYFFKEQGFSVYRIAHNGAISIPVYRESDEYFRTTNYLAVNNRV